MTDDLSPSLSPLVVGANHRSTSLTLRDRLFVEDAAVPGALARLKGRGINQAVVLSTCDRVEVVAMAADPDTAGRAALDAMAEWAGFDPAALAGQIYRHVGDDAVRHLFTVAGSLDSLVVGEPQVLGQVKACHALAREAGMVGSELETLLQAAYAVAKRIRSETKVGEGPVSIAAAAVQLARDVHGDLGRAGGLLIGAGDMGELVVEGLRGAGLTRLAVTHPTPARAEALAQGLGCHVAPFAQLANALAEADVVVASLNGRNHVLAADLVRAALKARRNRPMFIVDTGIPGDVEPAVNRIDEAFLYDLNDLERVAMEGRASRESEARAARSLLDRELANFLRGRAARAAVPALTALRERFEAERGRVLAECGGDGDKATRLLINRLLHEPSEALKTLAAEAGDVKGAEALLRRLFRLDGGGR